MPENPVNSFFCVDGNTYSIECFAGNYRTAASSRKLKFIPDADEVIMFCLNQLKVGSPRLPQIVILFPAPTN